MHASSLVQGSFCISLEFSFFPFDILSQTTIAIYKIDYHMTLFHFIHIAPKLTCDFDNSSLNNFFFKRLYSSINCVQNDTHYIYRVFAQERNAFK